MATSVGAAASIGGRANGCYAVNTGIWGQGNGTIAAPQMRVMHTEPTTLPAVGCSQLVSRLPSQRDSSGKLSAQTQLEISELVESIHVEDGDGANVRDKLVDKFSRFLQEKGKQQQQMLQEAEAKLWALEQRNHDLVVENYQLRAKAFPAPVPGTREPVLSAPGRCPTPAVQAGASSISRHTSESVQLRQPIAMTPRGPLTATIAVAPTPPVAGTAVRVRSASPGPRPAWANTLVSGPVAPQTMQSVLMEPVTAQASPATTCRGLMTTPTFEATFDSIDTNHDGVISRSEWARAAHSGGVTATRATTPTPCRDQLFLPSSYGAVVGSPQQGVGRSAGLMPGSPGAAGSMSVPPGTAAGSLFVSV